MSPIQAGRVMHQVDPCYLCSPAIVLSLSATQAPASTKMETEGLKTETHSLTATRQEGMAPS